MWSGTTSPLHMIDCESENESEIFWYLYRSHTFVFLGEADYLNVHCTVTSSLDFTHTHTHNAKHPRTAIEKYIMLLHCNLPIRALVLDCGSYDRAEQRRGASGSCSLMEGGYHAEAQFPAI
jgi:hypothetical protein